MRENSYQHTISLDLDFKKCTVLDVGCGLHPRGDVNVDLFLDSRHRRSGNGPSLDTETIQNFVQADGRDMYMFKDREFDTVRCHHVIEHLPAPARAICSGVSSIFSLAVTRAQQFPSNPQTFEATGGCGSPCLARISLKTWSSRSSASSGRGFWT